MPANEGYFNAKRDIEIINAVGFFCEACLVGKPVVEQSPDLRYCQDCYEFLKAEAKMLPATKCPAWRPKPQQRGQEKTIPVSQDMVSNMSTLAGKKSEVDIIHPADAITTLPKRGPKYKALPVELITKWASEAMGSKAIASRLQHELGIVVSYKTIQRLLSGERKWLALSM